MYYICQNGDDFGFKCDEVHEITETDVLISDEIYKQFFDAQCCGKSFRIKNINGATFEEIFEEYVLEYEDPEPTEIDLLKQRIEELEKIIRSLTNSGDGIIVNDGGVIVERTTN